MNSHETTLRPDAVEEIFCKEFEKAQRHEMPKEDAELLISLMMKEKTSLDKTPFSKKEKPFLYQLIENRIHTCLTFRITDSRLIIFLCVITKFAGTAVMYLAYLQYWCKKNNITELDMDIFCERIFPMGFPCERDLHTIWDKQKVKRTENGAGSDNLLDYQTAYKSIQFELTKA